METVTTTNDKPLRTLQIEAESLKDAIDTRNKWLNDDSNKSKFNYPSVASNTREMQENYDRIMNKIKQQQNG